MDKLEKLTNEIYKEFAADGISLDDAREMAEMELKAKANGCVVDAAKGKPRGKSDKPREKKVDLVKKAIIADIAQILREKYEIVVTNDEKIIDLTVNGENFTINLVKHRKK